MTGRLDILVNNAAFTGAVDAATLYQQHAQAAGIDLVLQRMPEDGYWSETWMQKPFVGSYWGGRPTADLMLSVAYLGLMPGFLLAMRRWHSAWAILAILLITKMGDTGAYFTGRMLGRHKLIPWVSPGKTWEGLAGAVVWSTLFAIFFAWLSQHTDLMAVYRTQAGSTVPTLQPRHYHLGVMALCGVLLAVVGHAGDLTMSLFKRDAGIKDSGSVIPGMGGLLDLLDSPLLAAPVAYWMLAWAWRAM